jgi:AhpD family alkylhydroperoxidase
MTTLRFEYRTHAPEMLKSMRQLSAQLRAAGIGQRLVDLVYLRVSQINGCAYCVNLHTNDLRQVDEPQVRLDQLVVWRHSPHFTAAERAAFAYTESLTLVAETHAPDEDFAALKAHYSDAQITELTFAIAHMNALNRIAVGAGQAAPE